MVDRKQAFGWAFVVGSCAIGFGAGWLGAKAFQWPQLESSAIATTIQQIRSHPQDFAGRRVRLAGQLDECYQWECSLCPEGMTSDNRTADRCLALSFRALVNGTGFGSAEQEKVFRFSSVILTAHFDPTCWDGGCLDRQTVLEDARILSVTGRRAGASGLWVGDTTKLLPLEEAPAGEIKMAALRAGYPDSPPIRAFRTGGAEPRFVVCWSVPGIAKQDPGTWPITLESALFAQSTLDFFECNEVRKAGDQMVVQVRE